MTQGDLEDFLRLGIIQTTVDDTAAWASGISMTRIEEESVIAEMQQHLAALAGAESPPQIVLLPEVTVPIGFVERLRGIAINMNSILIAGLDFDLVPDSKPLEAMNRAVVIVPNKWGAKHSTASTVRYVGKTYPAYREQELLRMHGYAFCRIPEVWLFEAGRYGRFGVVVCVDLLDLERVAMYRMNIQHLFVVAYNMDITSFDHAAEALARMVFCNVVICNTGQYGGSLAVSPYKRPERRLIYRHSGSHLATSQIVELPVKALCDAQRGADSERVFKALPPGASSPVTHQPQQENIDTG